jgi:hypothetical protein
MWVFKVTLAALLPERALHLHTVVAIISSQVLKNTYQINFRRTNKAAAV